MSLRSPGASHRPTSPAAIRAARAVSPGVDDDLSRPPPAARRARGDQHRQCRAKRPSSVHISSDCKPVCDPRSTPRAEQTPRSRAAALRKQKNPGSIVGSEGARSKLGDPRETSASLRPELVPSPRFARRSSWALFHCSQAGCGEPEPAAVGKRRRDPAGLRGEAHARRRRSRSAAASCRW